MRVDLAKMVLARLAAAALGFLTCATVFACSVSSRGDDAPVGQDSSTANVDLGPDTPDQNATSTVLNPAIARAGPTSDRRIPVVHIGMMIDRVHADTYDENILDLLEGAASLAALSDIPFPYAGATDVFEPEVSSEFQSWCDARSCDRESAIRDAVATFPTYILGGRALGIVRTEEAVSILMTALDSPNNVVAMEAALSLAWLDRKEARQAILEWYEGIDNPSPGVRLHFSRAMLLFDDDVSWSIVQPLLGDDELQALQAIVKSDLDARDRILSTVGRSGNE